MTAISQAGTNDGVWSRGRFVSDYGGRRLRPVEVILLARHADALSGRVLELGCGRGRLTSYLVELAAEVHGIDLAPAMVAHCRGALPQATFHEGDLRDLSRFDDASFDAVLAPWNVLDVLDDRERAAVLDDIRRVLTDRGMVVLSSHNRGHASRVRPPTRVRTDHPLHLAADVARLPRRLRNRRRLAPLERYEPEYAVLNDSAHNYSLLHYYISRDAQQRQLAAHGFDLLECLDLDGRRVEAGEEAEACSELHYVARRTP